MTIQPSSLDDLRQILARACGAKVSSIDLRDLNRVVAHAPDDMTVTVEAGIALDQLQSELARRRQWLPIDPPNPERLTIGALLATNASGPRRFGYGTIRDYLIGIKAVLSDGRVIQSGGRVVKNVAGYDLAKLFIGSHDTLGVIVEATFKLRPLPEAEQFVQARSESLQDAARMVDALIQAELSPVVLDMHAPARDSRPSTFFIVLGFAGTREDVEWQRARAHELGLTEPATLDHERHFWSGAASARQVSVLPSCLTETVRQLGDLAFVARAGNGVIYYRGGPPPAKEALPVKLMQRVKDEFDPKHILPELPV